ncbi:MAG: hypothetical protein LBS19_02060 [Clostridiales bacterium]|jgi:beta-fructofuranosidase|nr:hypothetical protein [Clostridiales bacterium]
MNYHPEGMQMWDAWYWAEGSEVHAFHLQRLRPGSKRSEAESDGIGHAVSSDLVNWQERPVALLPGLPGDRDDMGLFTGCTHGANGRHYMFYTMRGSRDNGRVQSIGAAVSDDGDLNVWTKYSENPVIVPDKQLYASPDNPALYGTVDCRDLCIVNSPDGKGYYGFFAARVPSEEMPLGAVIACCYSEDLLHWKQLPPAFQAKRFAIVEVPEVFFLEGRWYMLMLCNNEYGSRDIFPAEPRLTMGTVYAVADRPEGPYRLQDDYILMASETYNGISCRTVMFKGERMVLYTSIDRSAPFDSASPCMGVLSTPKRLAVQNGRLRMLYSTLIEAQKRERILHIGTPEYIGRLPYETPGLWPVKDGAITGSAGTAWARYMFEAKSRAFIYTCSINIRQGVGAGLVFKAAPNGYGGCVFMLNAEKQEVQFLRLPNLFILDSRSFEIEFNRTYSIRVVSKEQYLEMYVDDELILQCVHYASRDGYLGLITDRAEVRFKDPEAYMLDCPLDD